MLSVLEQVPYREDRGPAQALRDTLDFARAAEALGYRRFWLAEHHAIGAVVSSAPEVMIGQVATATTQIRVGSGGMLLPNHRPLHVAEQFRTLAALHPDRIDLGIGRSEGALDPATVQAFARAEDSAHGGGYERQLDELLAFGGVTALPADDPLAGVRAMPVDVALPPVYLLGSSLQSAENAARRGLAYAFAAYSNPDIAAAALRTYRDRFEPGEQRAEPYALLGLKVMVGEDDEHARALMAPWHLGLVQARAGQPRPLCSVERALAHEWTDAERAAEAEVDVRADAVGGPQTVRARLDELRAQTLADELIISTNTHDPADRLASFERLAGVTRPSAPARAT